MLHIYLNIPNLTFVDFTYMIVIVAQNNVLLSMFGQYLLIGLWTVAELLWTLLCLVPGPVCGTPDCMYCVVYMLPALHRMAFYYLRVSCIRGLVTSGLCSGSDSHGVFLMLRYYFVLYLYCLFGGGGCSTSQWLDGGGGSLFHRFSRFRRLVSLCGADL